MAKYKFQFKTGHIYGGSTELEVNDFIAEFDGEMNPALALTIEAHGGQLVKEEPKKVKDKVNPVKWTAEEGEK